MILFIKHIDIEGPGTIAPFFEKLEEDLKIVELAAGEALPEDISEISGVVVLGGPMNVYEEDKCPWLIDENTFIQKVIRENIPLLGICLGSQLIAKACGANVTKSPNKEIGWSKVQLTEDGRKDPLLKGVDANLGVFQWHEDTFALPDGATLLATAQACAHQAYRVGDNAYGLQFHVEVTDEIIASWIERYFKVDDAASHSEGRRMLEQYTQLKDEFDEQAEIIYENFSKIVRNKNAASRTSSN